jgi:hypothetical protein
MSTLDCCPDLDIASLCCMDIICNLAVTVLNVAILLDTLGLRAVHKCYTTTHTRPESQKAGKNLSYPLHR